MLALRAASVMALLVFAGCAVTGPHADPRGRCAAPGAPTTLDPGTGPLWYLLCIQSP